MTFHLALNGTTFCDSGIGPIRTLFDASERGEISRREMGVMCSYCNRDDAEAAAALLARFGFPFEVVEGGCPSYGRSDYYSEDNG